MISQFYTGWCNSRYHYYVSLMYLETPVFPVEYLLSSIHEIPFSETLELRYPEAEGVGHYFFTPYKTCPNFIVEDWRESIR